MRVRGFARRGLLVVAAVLVASACGGSGGDEPLVTTSAAPGTTVSAGGTTSSTPPAVDETTTTAAVSPVTLPDPCSLLSAAEIESATGLPFGDGTFNAELSTDAFSICDWISSGNEFATAQVLIHSQLGAYESSKAGAAEVFPLIDVAITGADAAYATNEGSLIAMAVNGYFLQVAYIPPGPGDVLSETEQLATLAAGRL